MFFFKIQIHYSLPSPLRLAEWVCYDAKESKLYVSFPGDMDKGDLYMVFRPVVSSSFSEKDIKARECRSG